MRPFSLKEFFLPILLMSIYFANAQSGFGLEDETPLDVTTIDDLDYENPPASTTSDYEDNSIESTYRDKRDLNYDDSTNETTTSKISTITELSAIDSTTVTTETTLTSSQASKIVQTPLNIYEVTMNFLDTVKDSCEYLKHLSVVFSNDKNHRRMKYFEDIQMEFFTNLQARGSSLSQQFTKAHQEVKNMTNELWELLNESDESTENLENFFLNNSFKNKAMKLMNQALENKFMWELKAAAEKGLKNYSSGCETSTPSRMLYDFYIGGVFWMLKENALFSMAAGRLKGANNSILQALIVNSFKYHWTTSAYDPIFFNETIATTSSMTYVNLLPSNNKKFIGFKTFLQRLVNAEKNINGGSCDYRCDWITRMEYKNDGCFGELRSCEKYWTYKKFIEVAFSKDSTKIHDVVTNVSTSVKLYQYNTLLIFGYDCDICNCVCDQKWHKKTERFLYAGRIDAELGYAITGVRFAKEQGVIYLQIQSGQLNVDGYIIEDSVYWSDSPADLKTNVHTLDFENRKLLLNELKFKNSILTGLQITARNFTNYESTFSLRIFGKPVKNFTDPLSITLTSNPSRTSLDFKKSSAGLRGNKYAPYKLTYGLGGSVAVQFETSSIDSGMGQETVPQFNAEDVTLSPPIPASGIGLMHYTDDESYAGYVKPYLISFNGDF